MMVQLLLLVIGFVFLIKGADLFVDGASSTASNWKVPKSLIGLTIVAFGTSAPELAVSIKALAGGASDIVLGNVVGSNILNILLILGVGALVRPLKIKKETVRKEIPICILISLIFVVLLSDTVINGEGINMISRSDGLAILLVFAVFLYYLVSMALKGADKKEVEKPKWKLVPSLFFTVVGLVGIVVGSNFVVDSATELAKLIGISERVIALSIVALGTSLPELVTTIVASRKGETELVLGNILGSNIFNICIVLGVPVVIFGAAIPEAFVAIDMLMLVGAAALLFVFSATRHEINRLEGGIMLVLFVVYYLAVFVP
ncbi:calcium/sodium antiporter [Candidatus Saccharibacteria bacterium]|nr:calcium/sodium antiporter [Candidatus Saccharibacteria bacterium]